MQTICPHCQTVFKVSNENLKAADGYVRCGICKEVFNALETDLPKEEKEPVAETGVASTAETPVDKNIEPDDTDSVDLVLEQSDEVSTGKELDSLPATEDIDNKEEVIPAIEMAGSDENAQTDLFAASAEIEEPKSETEPVTAEAVEAVEEPEAIEETIEPETVEAETSETDSVVTEIETAPEFVAQIDTQEETDNETPDEDAENITEPPSAIIAAAISTSKASVSSTAETDSTPNHSNMDNSLFDGVQSKLIPDEYRIPELHNTYSLWRDVTWSLAILILTACLFVEYTWFNRNELISHPQLSPLVSQLCNITDCNIMDLREPDEIEMTTRNIYTHPNVKNALMISGSLINHASFEQPYPDILIDFSDVRGEVIASRIFTPKDYLQIEVSSLKPMAPQVSVDFNMEIQDPGKQAITYEFSFL